MHRTGDPGWARPGGSSQPCLLPPTEPVGENIPSFLSRAGDETSRRVDRAGEECEGKAMSSVRDR